MPLDHPESILIVRLSAIGDVVHALPCLHALRERFPDARIGWLVEQLSASLLKGHPEIDDLYVIPKKHWRAAPVRTWLNGEKRRFYGELRRAKWDVAIDFQGLTKSGIPLLFSGAPVRIGFGDKDGREFNKFFTNRRVVPSPERPHVIQRNLSLLEPLGIENPEVAWRFPDFAEERATTDTALTDAGIDSDAGFIALYPGAGWETKRWPTKHFARLSRLLGENPGTADLPQLIIWGPGEEPLCEAILRDAELPEHRLRMAPPTNLRELAALLGRARLMVGGDTGPVHLAAALGVPVAGIYGGSDPVRNGPWGSADTTLVSNATPCTICWRTVCNRQPRLGCMETLPPERVAEAAARALRR